LDVDPYAAHERHIEHQRTVSGSEARDVVASALNAEQEVVFARKPNAFNHVGNAAAARDNGGLPVDHGVPDGSGLLMAGVTRQEQLPSETRPEALECILLQVELATVCRYRPHGSLLLLVDL
jgi:hypothetical protein